MDTNSNATDPAQSQSKPSVNEPLDPSRRYFVPIEKRMTNGNWTFQTIDKERYYRTSAGVILRVAPKVNGKQAKRARQKARRTEDRGAR